MSALHYKELEFIRSNISTTSRVSCLRRSYSLLFLVRVGTARHLLFGPLIEAPREIVPPL